METFLGHKAFFLIYHLIINAFEIQPHLIRDFYGSVLHPFPKLSRLFPYCLALEQYTKFELNVFEHNIVSNKEICKSFHLSLPFNFVTLIQFLLLLDALITTGALPLTRFSYDTVFCLTRSFFDALFSHLVLNQSSFKGRFFFKGFVQISTYSNFSSSFPQKI